MGVRDREEMRVVLLFTSRVWCVPDFDALIVLQFYALIVSVIRRCYVML